MFHLTIHFSKCYFIVCFPCIFPCKFPIFSDLQLTFDTHYFNTLLQKKCEFDVENISPGIYHVEETGFPVYIIVTQLLPPEEYLYLYCVADEIREPDLRYVERMEHDYRIHRNDEPRVYGSYIRQLQNAYGKAKGSATMAAAKKVKSIYDMDIVELIDENERQKNIYDMNIVKLTRENEKVLSEAAAYKQRIAELEDQIRQLSKLAE